MSSKAEPVVLTHYSLRKQESIETYFHEWKSIHQSQTQTNGSGNETDEELQEKEEQGKSAVANKQMSSDHLSRNYIACCSTNAGASQLAKLQRSSCKLFSASLHAAAAI